MTDLTPSQSGCIMSLPAKVLWNVTEETVVFLFLNRSYHTIIKRPPAVTSVTLTLAGSDPRSDTGGRAISDPWHAVGPPEIKKRQTG
jgi:hypothetical protein